MSHNSNVSDYDLIYYGETDKALKVARDFDGEAFWLPKSQIEADWKGKPVKHRAIIVVTIPDWLAEKHDLA